MTTETTTLTPSTKSAAAARLALAVLAAAAANTLIALIAESHDRGGIGMGLSPVAYLPATVAGFLAGSAALTRLTKRAPHLVRRVVPLVAALSWAPDVLLLTMGATAANVIGLMLMHVVVITAVVTGGRVRRS